MSMIASAWLALALVQAPTAGELGCVLQSATAADREEISAGMRRGNVDEALVGRIREQAGRCAGPFGWSEERTAAMTVSALASVTRESIATILADRGIDTAIIDRWFARQDEDMRTRPEFDQARGEAIALGLVRAGIPMERLAGDSGETVGNYVATLIISERVRLGLPMH
jgi:hypothetical protein